MMIARVLSLIETNARNSSEIKNKFAETTASPAAGIGRPVKILRPLGSFDTSFLCVAPTLYLASLKTPQSESTIADPDKKRK